MASPRVSRGSRDDERTNEIRHRLSPVADD